MGSVGNTTFHQSLTDWEARYRNSQEEHGAYFDKDGNLLLESTGDGNVVEFTPEDMNHFVEQRVWNDEEVNFSHNHPENTIFSPEDVEEFEFLENHSERAILPNGTTYTLVRVQPRTSNELVWNEEKQDFERTFEPQKIAPAYREAYKAVYDPEYKRIHSTMRWGSAEMKAAEQALDRRVATEMERWLKQNAKSYGYRFEKRRK